MSFVEELLDDVRNDYVIEKVEDKKEMKLKDKDLEPKPLFNTPDDYFEPPHKNLLRGPFSLLLVAPKGSGKTTILHNLMVWYFSFFDSIFIWSPTVDMDIKWKLLIEELQIPEENIFIKYNEMEVQGIIDKIKELNEGKECNNDKVRVMFVFDDIIDQLPKNVKETALNRLAFNHRHYNISHFIVSQSFKKIDCNVRSNTTGLVLFNTDNSSERKKIIEELCGNLGLKYFNKLYRDCVREKYSFMYINYDQRKVYKKFSKCIANLDDEIETQDF